MIKQSIVHTYEEFVKLIFNPGVEVAGLVPIDDDTVLMSWRATFEAYETSHKANVVIAACTTAQARLKLHSYLNEQGRNVLYYDTDSVMYESNGKNDLKLGNCLGDLTDELESYGSGSYISSFVSGGAKFYSYIVQKPDGNAVECSKLNGVRSNFNTRQNINHESIRNLIVEGADPFQINSRGIRRLKYHQVVTKREEKIIRATGPKRRFHGDDGGTLPYGYKRPISYKFIDNSIRKS